MWGTKVVFIQWVRSQGTHLVTLFMLRVNHQIISAGMTHSIWKKTQRHDIIRTSKHLKTPEIMNRELQFQMHFPPSIPTNMLLRPSFGNTLAPLRAIYESWRHLLPHPAARHIFQSAYRRSKEGNSCFHMSPTSPRVCFFWNTVIIWVFPASTSNAPATSSSHSARSFRKHHYMRGEQLALEPSSQAATFQEDLVRVE